MLIDDAVRWSPTLRKGGKIDSRKFLACEPIAEEAPGEGAGSCEVLPKEEA